MSVCLVKANGPIQMHEKGSTGNHGGLPIVPADMPEVYYDSDNLEIIIVADGFASYYDVEIFQTEYTIPVISTQIDGSGDSIDISSLSDGSYTIVITSSNNNEFEGTFYIEWWGVKMPDFFDEMGIFWKNAYY